MGTEDAATPRKRLIPHVTIAEMTPDTRALIDEHTPYDLMWTEDWSPEFYRAQARLGFIAVAGPGPGEAGNVLLPEFQHEYAVLDWQNLIVDRGVRKILQSGRLEREAITLVVETEPARALEGLDGHWGDRSWLRPEYVSLVRLLATAEQHAADPGFRILGTILMSGDETVSGELGYAVGRVYVSLSGFFRRERREWNHFGKLQMVLLARRLEDAGFAFWNLGHARMEYKTSLGARILPRSAFLPRWDSATAGKVPDLAEH